MNRKPTVSISIVTRNRLFELERCLKSLVHQSTLPDEVIVIDNSPEKSAENIVNKNIFFHLNIVYLYCSGTVPQCRNKAIKISSSSYLGFIDDDCVVHKSWVKKAKKLIYKSQPDVVLGKTYLLNTNNLFALAQHARDAYWKEYNHQLFDTKNALINLKAAKKANIFFDENCQYQWYDSGDFDFDFQLRKRGWKRTYCPSMVVWHEETSRFGRFKSRAFARGYLARYLDNKWDLGGTLVDRSTRYSMLWFLKTIKNFLTDWKRYEQEMNNSNIFNKIFAVIIIKFFEWFYIRGYEANT